MTMTKKEAFRNYARSARMPIAAAIRAIDTASDYDRPQELARAVKQLDIAKELLVRAVKARKGVLDAKT